MAKLDHLRPFLPYTKWGASIFGISGAILIASNISISGWAFVIYLIGSSLWVFSAMVMREKALLTETSIYVVINIIGIWRWLG